MTTDDQATDAAARMTFWLADPVTMTARPVVCRPSRVGLGYWEPVKRSDHRYICVQFFTERWEAEAAIVLQLAHGDRTLQESRP